jgi:Ni/Co efflux regulator RcnB
MRFVSAPLAAAAFFGLPMAAQATVHIHIDLTRQTMHVASRNGEYDWPVSTGRPGHRTPTGVYHPQRMFAMTYSRKYDNAPMPHAIFFTGGYAIHGTGAVGSLGSVASHGCVRLAPENAAALYEMVKHEGASIVIGGHAPGREQVAEGRERHRAGHRLAAHWRKRYLEEPAFAYAPQPRHHARTLRDWVNSPLENW